MLRTISLSIILALVCLPGLLPAQDNRWSLAFRSSYFGSQSSVSDAVTSIENPITVGGYVRYRAASDVTVQLAHDYVRGDMKDGKSRETVIQSSLSFMAHLFGESTVSPYFTSGLGVMLRSEDRRKTMTKLKFLFGAGFDARITNRVFLSAELSLMSNGWNYNGWNGSTGIGIVL